MGALFGRVGLQASLSAVSALDDARATELLLGFGLTYRFAW